MEKQNYIVYFVDMNHVEQTFNTTAKNYEAAEQNMRKKHKVYYMWKIEEVTKKGNKKVFP